MQTERKFIMLSVNDAQAIPKSAEYRGQTRVIFPISGKLLAEKLGYMTAHFSNGGFYVNLAPMSADAAFALLRGIYGDTARLPRTRPVVVSRGPAVEHYHAFLRQRYGMVHEVA